MPVSTSYALLVRLQRLFVIFSIASIIGLLGEPASAQDLSREELRLWIEHILELERRVEIHGDDVQLMIRLTDAYIRIGDARRAGPALDRLSDMGVAPLRIAVFRGDLHFILQEYDRAARSYLEALGHAPRQTYSLSQLWRLMLEVTLSNREINFDRIAVIETLQRAGLYFPGSYSPARNGPDQASRLVDRASALLIRDRTEQALVLLHRAISIDPGNADAFSALARVYEANNDPQSAIGAYLVYLVLAPDASDSYRVRRYIGREIERDNLR